VGHIRDRWKDPARKGKGKRWQVKYQADGRERDGGSFDVKAVAQRRLVELEAAVQRGQWVDPTDQTTVTELVRAHAATRTHRPRTAARIASMIGNHVEKTPLGGRRVASVRPSEAQAWASDRAKHLAPSTLRILVTLVRGAFTAAALDHLVAANPFARVILPRVERGRIVPLTVEQVAALADAIGDRYRAMVIVQAACGLRIGELLALRTQDVDFLRRTLRVEDQIDRVTRERVPPKTPRSRRTVPLPQVASEALARHIAAYPPTAEGLIFHTRSGLPIAHDWYGNKVFVRAAERAGLPAGTTPHACRHHYASVLLASGQSVIAVAELLGHDNANLVLSTYGHLMPGGDDLARRAVEAAWTAAETPSVRPATTQGLPE
jgi:integrase